MVGSTLRSKEPKSCLPRCRCHRRWRCHNWNTTGELAGFWAKYGKEWRKMMPGKSGDDSFFHGLEHKCWSADDKSLMHCFWRMFQAWRVCKTWRSWSLHSARNTNVQLRYFHEKNRSIPCARPRCRCRETNLTRLSQVHLSVDGLQETQFRLLTMTLAWDVGPGDTPSFLGPKNHPGPGFNIWLVVYLPLWKIWKSVGMMTFPIYGKIIQMFQTTNQIWFSYV